MQLCEPLHTWHDNFMRFDPNTKEYVGFSECGGYEVARCKTQDECVKGMNRYAEQLAVEQKEREKEAQARKTIQQIQALDI